MILGSVHILKMISDKLQDTSKASLQRIKLTHSCFLYQTYTNMAARPEREHSPLNYKRLHTPREFTIHQKLEKLVSLKIHPTLPVGYHLTREIRFIYGTTRTQT